MQYEPYQSHTFDNRYPYSAHGGYQNYGSPAVTLTSKPKTDRKIGKVRTVVDSQSSNNNNTEFKKMLGILIILLIVVFFTVFINIVITLMKPGCKCNNMIPPMQLPMSMPMPAQYWGPPV
jgi:hypothetical protein